MNDLNTIRFNFDKAKAKADEMDNVANELQRIVGTQTDECLEKLAAGWQGIAFDAFCAKSNVMADEVEGMVKTLHKGAKTLREIAQKIYDAEMAAYELALVREQQK